MAIGARHRDIGLQFLIEAGLLALLGSVAGVAVALGGAASFGAEAALTRPETVATILAAMAIAALVTLASALYPAHKAACLDPAEALM